MNFYTKLSILVFSFAIAFQCEAEEIRLQCAGTAISFSTQTDKTTTTPESAFIVLDTASNKFSLDGYVLFASLDPEFKGYTFIADEKEFRFSPRYKTEQMNALTTLSINRYTSQMDTYEAVVSKSGLNTIKGVFKCQLVTQKKF